MHFFSVFWKTKGDIPSLQNPLNWEQNCLRHFPFKQPPVSLNNEGCNSGCTNLGHTVARRSNEISNLIATGDVDAWRTIATLYI